MDSSSNARQVQETTKTTRKRKISNMNQPLKVVYISNPMRVQTSAAKFRALVQELTGRDAELPNPTASIDARETNTQKKQEVEENEDWLLDLAAVEDLIDDYFGGSYDSLENIFTA